MAPRKKKVEVDESAIAENARELARIKAEIDVLDKQRKALQTELVTTLMGSDRDSITVDIDESPVKVTVVAPEKTVIDEGRLKKKLGATAWKKVTVTKLDRDRLEAAVQLGEINITDVAECTELVPTQPYIKLGKG